MKTNLTLKSTELLVAVSVLHAALEIRHTIHVAATLLVLIVQMGCHRCTLFCATFVDLVDRPEDPASHDSAEDCKSDVFHVFLFEVVKASP